MPTEAAAALGGLLAFGCIWFLKCKLVPDGIIGVYGDTDFRRLRVCIFIIGKCLKQVVFLYDSYNYKEYLNFEDKYGNGATNIAYTFDMVMMGKPVRVSNLPQKQP